MNCSYRLSNVTQDYLAEFEYILDEMIRGMTEAPFTCSISYNFIVQMIPHHMAAIEMSHNILKYTTNIQVQDIASNIITSQTKSINNMRNIPAVSYTHLDVYKRQVPLQYTTATLLICLYLFSVRFFMSSSHDGLPNGPSP